MTDLNFDSFKRYLDESHTEEGRKRQEEDSIRALILHGRASEREVEADEDGEGEESAVPQPLKRAGRQQDDWPDNDPLRPPKAASTVDERWTTLKKEHGTWGNR